jgi:hypothetical protein
MQIGFRIFHILPESVYAQQHAMRPTAQACFRSYDYAVCNRKEPAAHREDEFNAIPGRKYTGMMKLAHKHATHYVCFMQIVGLRVLVTLAGATKRPSEVFTDTCRLLSCTQHVEKSTCSIPPKHEDSTSLLFDLFSFIQGQLYL